MLSNQHRLLLALVCALSARGASAAFKCAVCDAAPADAVAATAAATESSTDGGSSGGALAEATFCPAHSWYVCLDAAAPTPSWNAADAAARGHYAIATGQISAAGIPLSKRCHNALRSWICAAHFPVCEASTHGRAVCDTEFTDITEVSCPEVFGDPQASTAAAAAAAAAKTSHGSAFNATETAMMLRAELAFAGTRNGSVVSEDHGSCVHLNYSGPNYWNWVVCFCLFCTTCFDVAVRYE